MLTNVTIDPSVYSIYRLLGSRLHVWARILNDVSVHIALYCISNYY